MSAQHEPVTGMILDETVTFNLDELCGTCRIESQVIVEMVEEGIVEPIGQETTEWRFTASQLPRVRRAVHLYHDLELNLAGVALALDLLDEVSELRTRLQQMEMTL